MRVEFSSVEDVRRVLFLELEGAGLSQRERSRVAGVLTGKLRAAGLLAGSVEQHYSAVQVAALLNRGDDYVCRLARSGKFGPVMRDDGGWIIPASGVQAWLASVTVASSSEEVAA